MKKFIILTLALWLTSLLMAETNITIDKKTIRAYVKASKGK